MLPSLIDDVREDLYINASLRRDREYSCRLCGGMFTPPHLCFYQLCDKCFSMFDYQKMSGRLLRVFKGVETPYFENAAKWVEWKKGEGRPG